LLLRPDAIRPALKAFTLPTTADAGQRKFHEWATLFAKNTGIKRKETELLTDFLRDVFVDLLGYVPPPAVPYTFKSQPHIEVDGKFADAGLGHFTDAAATFTIVLEGKGPKDPLDRPFAGRKYSAVDQALKYAVQLQIDWYLVTNIRELRLYHKGHDTFTSERFETAKLAKDPAELARFVFLLGAERVLAPAGNHLGALLAHSKKIGRELTNSFYAEYKTLRQHTFDQLRTHNPAVDPSKLLTATQKILDRVLFIAFGEDRDLLPRDIIATAYKHSDPFNPRPVWQNFVGLFRAVDAGNEQLKIWKYNGGLFAPDPFLDSVASMWSLAIRRMFAKSGSKVTSRSCCSTIRPRMASPICTSTSTNSD
jgi:hypothetical protein